MEKELCPKCNQPKEMYYELFCPRCDKPGMETIKFYNLFRCMYYIEANGNPGYKERLWDHLTESDLIRGNDSYILLYNDSEATDDMKLLFDTFDIKEETMTFNVSW